MEVTKSNRAFVTFGIGQSFIDNCEILANYLLKYTTADVLIYYGKGTPSPSASPRLHKINLEELDLNFDIKKFPNPLNPFIIKETLSLYDEVAYLDSDIQVTPNVKDIFQEVFKITTYPLACRYPWYYTMVNGNNWVGDKIIQSIPYENQTTPTLGVSCTVSNKSCIPFLSKWIDLSLELCEPDRAEASEKEGIHEEAIFNALVWQTNGNNFITTKLAWAPTPEAILEALEIYASPEEKPYHPDATNPSFILEKNTWGGGMSCIPLNKNELWGLHTIKTPHLVKEAYLYIEKHF